METNMLVVEDAYRDWLKNAAYVDGNGNYHVKGEHHTNGPIAPWNKTIKRLYADVEHFHKAAHAWQTTQEPEHVYISMSSHRTRESVKRVLWHALHYVYSFQRSTTGGYARVTAEEYMLLKAVKGVTKLRAPYDDLHQCY